MDRPENLRLTISNLFQAGVIPILNGNDTVNKVEDGIDLKKVSEVLCAISTSEKVTESSFRPIARLIMIVCPVRSLAL